MKIKNKIIVIMFLLVSCITTICFATTTDLNNIDENVKKAKETENVNAIKSEITDTLSKTNIKKENIYRFESDKCEITDTIYGNVFVAGNEINIKSNYIAGDVFVFGNTITIDENTVIDGNIYIVGQQININGTIYRTSYVLGKVIESGKNSDIGYDTFMAADTIKLNGEMSRNVYISANILEVKNSALINGNLLYSSSEKAEIPKQCVKGKIDFKKIVNEEKDIKVVVFEYVVDMFKELIFTEFIFILILLISKKFTIKAQNAICNKNLFKSLGIGLLGFITIPLIIIMLILLGVTTKISLFLIPIYIAGIMIADSIIAISISALICAKKPNMKLPIVVPFIAIILWAVESIPYIGAIISFFSVVIGIGILLQNLFGNNNIIEEIENNKG